jgi:hypothetical protein
MCQRRQHRGAEGDDTGAVASLDRPIAGKYLGALWLMCPQAYWRVGGHLHRDIRTCRRSERPPTGRSRSVPRRWEYYLSMALLTHTQWPYSQGFTRLRQRRHSGCAVTNAIGRLPKAPPPDHLLAAGMPFQALFFIALGSADVDAIGIFLRASGNCVNVDGFVMFPVAVNAYLCGPV